MNSVFGRLLLIVLSVCALASGCIQRKEITRPDSEAGLGRLAEWMSGSFSSQQQSQHDSSYYDIRLEMVPIWTEREDGYWLYVEQSMATHLDQPYRQRIYHLSPGDSGTFRSTVFELPDPHRFIGAWRTPSQLSILTPDSLTERLGCDIVLREQGDSAFVGRTLDKECPSQLRGASYATSEVKVTESTLISWDRGFDTDGNQVWGAVDSGYVFRKVRSESGNPSEGQLP